MRTMSTIPSMLQLLAQLYEQSAGRVDWPTLNARAKGYVEHIKIEGSFS